jgi:thiazole/oxazole-forming peptide maturase SagC family component
MRNSLPVKPKIRSYFDVIFMEDSRCQIRAGDDTILVLRGRTVSELLPELFRHLDGTASVRDLLDRFKEGVSADDLLTILERLNAEGILEDGVLLPPPEITPAEREFYASQLLFFSHFAGDRYGYQRALQRARAAIIGLGDVGMATLTAVARSGISHIVGIDSRAACHRTNDLTELDVAKALPSTDELASLLASINPHIEFRGIDALPETEEGLAQALHGADIVIVALDKPQPSICERVNRICIEQSTVWMMCGCLNSVEGTVGPLFVPRQTCCYKCYDLRLKSNIEAYKEHTAFEEFLKGKEGQTADYGYPAPFPAVIGNLVALEVIKHVTQFSPPETYGALFCLNFLTLRSHVHEVFKLPRCPVCGSASDLPPKAFWSKVAPAE